MEGLGAAQVFHAEHGHLRVPVKYVTSEGFPLGKWIITQRTSKRKGVLAPDRVQALDELGMIWDQQQAAWEEHFDVVRAFKAVHGHLRITAGSIPDWKKYADWIRHQRYLKRRGELAPEREAALNELGIDWDPDPDWDTWLEALRAFRAEHGHLRVPFTYVTANGLRLGNKLCRLRADKDKLTPDQIARLDQLGVQWRGNTPTWEQGLAAIRAFRAKHGHLRVPKGQLVDGFDLAGWLNRLRSRRTQGKLTQGQITKLDEAGMDWNPRETEWRRHYGALVAYRAEFGHVRVPQDYVTADGIRLGEWVSRLRCRRSQGALTKDHVAALDALGFVWKPPRGAAARRPSSRTTDPIGTAPDDREEQHAVEPALV
jgi:hypothetical protein